MATRKMFVAANNQHRPDERWFVMGTPSKPILVLKLCVSAIVADRWVRIEAISLEDRADKASRF